MTNFSWFNLECNKQQIQKNLIPEVKVNIDCARSFHKKAIYPIKNGEAIILSNQNILTDTTLQGNNILERERVLLALLIAKL